MKYMILITAAMLFGSWAVAQTAEEMMAEHMANRKVSLLDATQEDGTHFKFEATAQVVAKTPEWDGNGEPPLALTKAVSLATENLKKKYPAFAQFELRAVGLTRIYNGNIKNRWYYHLDFNAKARVNETDATKSMTVILFLDGIIVQPRVATE